MVNTGLKTLPKFKFIKKRTLINETSKEMNKEVNRECWAWAL